jgi:hypothetical protein
MIVLTLLLLTSDVARSLMDAYLTLTLTLAADNLCSLSAENINVDGSHLIESVPLWPELVLRKSPLGRCVVHFQVYLQEPSIGRRVASGDPFCTHM